MIARRSLLTAGAGLILAGCDRVIQQPAARRILFAGEDMQRGLHRALTDRGALAPEYRVDQMSPIFRANGT
ncbi:MAG TPA: molybdopterin-binding protein, partial [Sphingomonas sp.]